MKLARRLIKDLISDGDETHLIDPSSWSVRALPTGIDTVDLASGIGGFPEGRLILLHGPEGGGKTTLAWHCAAEVQRMGGLPVFLDFENKADLSYAGRIGVDSDDLVLACPETIEEGFAFIDKVGRRAREESVDCPILIVWDSLHAAEAEARKKRSMARTEADVAAEDRRAEREIYKTKAYSPESHAYSHCCRHFVKVAARNRLTLLAISQVRVKVDDEIWGDHEKIGVGRAVNHYATQTLTFANRRRRGQTEGPRGEDITATFRKNQVADPYQVAKFALDYGLGINRLDATWRAACQLEIAGAPSGRGAWQVFTLDGQEHKVQGVTGYLKLARKSPGVHIDLRTEIRRRIEESLKGRKPEATSQGGEEEPPGE